MSLFDLLSNSLILAQTCPYLRLSSLLALSAASKSFLSLLYNSPYSFRYLDLSIAENVPVHNRLVRGHRSIQMDNYYSGALRWGLGSLKSKNVLKDVTTLVLDGLSVPDSLLNEILCDESYNVRILSIRGCDSISDSALMHILKDIMRPSRPEETPTLKGLYYFGVTDRVSERLSTAERRVGQAASGVTASPGAQLGRQLNQRSHHELVTGTKSNRHDWYISSGQILSPRFETEWVQMLQACSGVIAFDAVLCRHNRESCGGPNVATISLEGCHNCHSSPEGPAFAAESPINQLPLLAPPPLHSSSVRAAQKPALGDSIIPPFFARCRFCLENRWCERCNVWWCEDCYIIPKAQTQVVGNEKGHAGAEVNGNDSIKVHLGLCVQGCLMEEMYHGAGEGGMWG